VCGKVDAGIRAVEGLAHDAHPPFAEPVLEEKAIGELRADNLLRSLV